MSLRYYYPARDIFHAQLPEPAPVSEEDIKEAMRSYRVNSPQARAILSATRTKGFTLIQGQVQAFLYLVHRLIIPSLARLEPGRRRQYVDSSARSYRRGRKRG